MTDAYLGNPNLKKVNTPVEFTKEQILEYQKCAKTLFTLWEHTLKLYLLMRV